MRELVDFAENIFEKIFEKNEEVIHVDMQKINF